MPACACVSGIFSGQRTRERSTEPAQLGGGQRRDDIRQLVVQRIGTIEERLTADDRNRRKPGRKNTLVRTGAVICIELIKDWCETAALHSAKYNKTVMTATPVFEISAVLDNDFTRSNTARAVLHGEIHCRQHTDEIGICLQAYLFECKIVAEDGNVVTAVKAAELRIERSDKDRIEPLGVRLQRVTETVQIEGLILPVVTVGLDRRLGGMVYLDSDFVWLGRDTVGDVLVSL